MIRVGQVWVNGNAKLTVMSETDTLFTWQIYDLSTATSWVIHDYDKDKFHAALLELGWMLDETHNVEQILQRYDGEM